MEQTTNRKEKKKLNKKAILFKKYTFKVLMYFGLFLPMFILACVKFDDYFATNKDSFSVASGGILLAIFTLLLVKVGIRRLHKLITATFIVAIIWCLNSIISDFLIISCMFWIGFAIFSIFEIPASYYDKMLNTWNDEEIRVSVIKQPEEKEEETIEKEETIEADNYGEI